MALDEPLAFIQQNKFEEFRKLGPENGEALDSDKHLTFQDLREMLKEVYSMTEKSLLKQSDGSLGFLGEKNKESTEKRLKKFNTKIDKGFDRNKVKNKIILAEGDSWFQFPVNVKDIVDWLLKHKNFAVYSMAYGGDWLSNIIYEEKYIEELSIHQPDIFLMSGGGNDMVGDSKLAAMVSNHKDFQANQKYSGIEDLKGFEDLTDTDREEIIQGQEYITNKFYAFLIIMKAQYYLALHSIYEQTGKFKGMKTLLQGYDYAIPFIKDRFSFRYPLQWLINKMVDTGKWLSRPMRFKGITNDKEQRKIVKFMIFEFNEMLKDITSYFENVHHIDCRGIAKGHHDWFDELHLKSHVFKKVAKVYSMFINGKIEGKKSIKVIDYV